MKSGIKRVGLDLIKEVSFWSASGIFYTVYLLPKAQSRAVQRQGPGRSVSETEWQTGTPTEEEPGDKEEYHGDCLNHSVPSKTE